MAQCTAFNVGIISIEVASKAETMDKATMKGESLDWKRGPRPDKVTADEAEEIEEAVKTEKGWQGGGRKPEQEGVSGRTVTSTRTLGKKGAGG